LIRFADLRPTLEALHLEGKHDEMAHWLERAMRDVQGPQDWAAGLLEMRRLETGLLERHPALAVCYARTLMNNRLEREVLEFSEAVLPQLPPRQAAELWVDYALALANTGRESEAHRGLEQALPFLSPELSGVAQRRLGRFAFKLGLPWQDHLEVSKALLTHPPRMWGLTLDVQAWCLCESGDLERAQNLWLEALPCFPKDRYFQSWIHYNLGITTLRRGDLSEASDYLREAVRLSEHPEARAMHSTALLGLGLLRRSRGEWQRALQIYRDLLEGGSEVWVEQTALVAYIKCLRLAGLRREALEEATRSTLRFPEHAPLKVAKAAVHLAWKQAQHAQRELEGIPHPKTLVPSARWLFHLVWAELCRQAGDQKGIQIWLEGVPLDTVQVREEIPFFPELFAALERPPPPLEHFPLSVEVCAEGMLEVRVSGETLPLSATGRVAELLLYLLEHGGQATLEQLLTALFPEQKGEGQGGVRSNRRKAVADLIGKLRSSLGWADSVRYTHGRYCLDPSPEVSWTYDLERLREVGKFPRAFAVGIDTDWVVERREGWGI